MKTPQNLDRVFEVFRINYKRVPLEVFSSPYEIFVSTLLSARTNDDVTLVASQRLFKVASNIQSLHRLSRLEVEKLIYPVGFYKTKSKNLKKACEIIIDKFNGNIPSNRTDLLGLSGVGIKTANLVMNRAYKIPAISVDTHVHRISNLLGWVQTKSPEKTLIELEKVIPKRYWSDTNRLFVSIGRQYTTKTKLLEFLGNNNLI